MRQVLVGRTVLVTAERRAAEITTALERRGAAVVHAPVLSVVRHADDATLVERTRDLLAAPPDVVVATTGVGFRGWLAAAEAAGLGEELLAVLGDARLLARGPKAHGAIRGAGLEPEWVAPTETAAEVLEKLLAEGVRGVRVVVQHHGAGADGVDEALAAAGADVTSLVVYRWGPSTSPAAVADSVHRVADGTVDAIVFTSAPGVHEWLDAARSAGRLDDALEALRGPVLAATVGPVTAAPLRALDVPAMWPVRYRTGAMVAVLVAALAARPPVGPGRP